MIKTPDTPEHTGANEELNVDEIHEIDENDVEDLDLGYGNEDEQQNDRPSLKREASTDDDIVFDQKDEFVPQVNISSPFSSTANITRLRDSHSSAQGRLSMSQQSKFVSYCDDRLMEIQRKFVQSRGLAEENGYRELSPLLQDLKSLLDFIWYSIEGIPNTELLLKQNLDDMLARQFANTKSTNFGQTYYLIRVADDFLDYLTKFDLTHLKVEEQQKTVAKVFKFLMILDKVFAKCLEGLIPGNLKMNGTEMVRISGIAERTRMVLPQYLEQQKIHGYHYEVSKVYEETLERCA